MDLLLEGLPKIQIARLCGVSRNTITAWTQHVDVLRSRDRYIFETEDGKAHTRDWIIGNVHRICDKAKVPHVTAHAMRGLLATLTAKRGLA